MQIKAHRLSLKGVVGTFYLQILININTKQYKMSRKIQLKSSKEQKQLLIALLIGDGTITNHPDFKISHSEKQLFYIKWKLKLLDKYKILNGGLKFYESKAGYNKGSMVPTIRLKTTPTIKALRRSIYTPKKTITRNLLNWLTPLGLAIWYMDDGFININESNQRSSVQHTIKISTCVDYNTCQIIINYFKEIWNINFRPFLEKSKYYSIATSSEDDCIQFIKIVKPYILPEFLYKIRKNFTKEQFIEYQYSNPTKCETF